MMLSLRFAAPWALALVLSACGDRPAEVDAPPDPLAPAVAAARAYGERVLPAAGDLGPGWAAPWDLPDPERVAAAGFGADTVAEDHWRAVAVRSGPAGLDREQAESIVASALASAEADGPEALVLTRAALAADVERVQVAPQPPHVRFARLWPRMPGAIRAAAATPGGGPSDASLAADPPAPAVLLEEYARAVSLVRRRTAIDYVRGVTDPAGPAVVSIRVVEVDPARAAEVPDLAPAEAREVAGRLTSLWRAVDEATRTAEASPDPAEPSVEITPLDRGDASYRLRRHDAERGPDGRARMVDVHWVRFGSTFVEVVVGGVAEAAEREALAGRTLDAVASRLDVPGHGTTAPPVGRDGVARRDEGSTAPAVEPPPRKGTRLDTFALMDEIRGGRYVEAEARLRAAIAAEPAAPGLRTRLGDLYATQSRWPEAVAAYREALRLAPRDAVAHATLAGTLLRHGQAEEARREALEARRLGLAEHWVYDQVGITGR